MKEASRNLQIVKEALENCVARLGFVSFDEIKGCRYLCTFTTT